MRHHHAVERPDGAASTLLLMPAWTDFGAAGTSDGGYIGVKVVTVSPDNNAIDKPAVMGIYLLLDGKTGEPQGADRRPAADVVARRPRPPRSPPTIWRARTRRGCWSSAPARWRRSWHGRMRRCGRSAKSESGTALRPMPKRWPRALTDLGHSATVAEDLDAALGWADIVSCATITTEPLVKGALLKPGTHVDLVGGFTPAMRESGRRRDPPRPRLCRHARRGDQGSRRHRPAPRLRPAEAGRHHRRSARAGARARRRAGESAEEITLFKSVGAALEDLAAAVSVFNTVSPGA